MRLLVDANVLVAELLRLRGQELIARPVLQLSIAATVWEEAEYERRKRVAIITVRGSLSADLADEILALALDTVSDSVVQIPQALYGAYEAVARGRIPRDPDDWHTVALALASNADIWTADADFLGCGVATWTTDTLLTHLAQMEGKQDG